MELGWTAARAEREREDQDGRRSGARNGMAPPTTRRVSTRNIHGALVGTRVVVVERGGGVVAEEVQEDNTIVGADSCVHRYSSSYANRGDGGFAIRGRRRGHTSSSSSSAPSSSSAMMLMSVSRAHAAERDARVTSSSSSSSSSSTGEGTGPGAYGGGSMSGIQGKTFLRLCAGVMSTCFVRTLLAPFERIKLEYLLNHSKLAIGPQVRKIVSTEGVKGFWKGNAINLLRVCPYKAINFASFDAFRGIAAMMSPGGPHDISKGLLAIAGGSAGIVSVTSCFPMDVVRTRLLVDGGMTKYGGVRACISALHKQNGLGAFYRGFLPAIISMVPNGAVYYTVYDRLKMKRLRQLEDERRTRGAESAGAGAGATRRSRRRAIIGGEEEEEAERRGKIGGGGGGVTTAGGGGGARGEDVSAPVRVEQMYMMLFGAMAGCASEFSTYPFEVVRRHMQLQGGKSSSMSHVVGIKALRRMAVTLRVIVHRRGLAGLYIGCLPSCLQVLPSAALGYYSYEMFKIFLNVD